MTKDEQQLLEWSANDINLEHIKDLVENKQVNINIKDNQLRTPLMIAIDSLANQVAHYLLQKNADVTLLDMFYDTALTLAVDKSKAGGKNVQARSNIEIIKSLVSRSELNINQKNHLLFSALDMALDRKNGEAVAVLLQRQDLDINIKNKYGTPPFLVAIGLWHSAPYIFEYFMQRSDLDINDQDKFGNTALISAIEKNTDAAVIDRLLKAGAEIDIKNADNRTAILVAEEAMKYFDNERAKQVYQLLKKVVSDNAVKALDFFGQALADIR